MRLKTSIGVLAVAASLTACGSESGGKTAEIPAGQTAKSATLETAPPPQEAAGACKEVAKPKPKPDGGAKKPTGPLDASKTWTLTFQTNCGDFTVKLDLKAAPNASASMVSLAKAGFFKNTIFHRIVPDFVIQGGDPTASGTGGPGYSTVDKPPANTRYTKGVVAMAKTPTERPGTAGSQFYVVTGADAGLPPEYAVLGRVTKGMAAVDRIGALGSQSEKPTQTIVIDDVVPRGK
jgi:peptidyl-prolyl cis-trans isomerase B (cyclophilin B)